MEPRHEFRYLRHKIGLRQIDVASVLGRSISWVRSVEGGAIECPPYAVLAMRRLDEHPEDMEATEARP